MVRRKNSRVGKIEKRNKKMYIDSNEKNFKLDLENNQGWICPKCGRVYSPNVNECDLCNLGKTTFPNVDDIPIVDYPDYSKMNPCAVCPNYGKPFAMCHCIIPHIYQGPFYTSGNTCSNTDSKS